MRTPMRPAQRMALSVAATIAAAATAASAQSFTGLGDLPGGSFYSEAWGVSGDGSTVVGASIVNGNPLFGATYAAFAWKNGTLMDIYNLGGIGTACRAYAANADGSVVVGSADYGVLSPTQIVAFIWFEESGVTEIGDLPGGPSGSAKGAARGVSADGMTVAGQGESDSGNEAFSYSVAESAFAGLGDLPGGTFSSSGFGISPDGGTIVGSSNSSTGVQAFRWNQEEGMVGIGYLPTAPGVTPFSEAYAASANGSVVVGLSRSMASGQAGWEAFRWTAAGGMVGLGDFPGGAVLSEAYAMTPDGSIVVGKGGILGNCTPFGCQTAPRAFIWDAAHGMRDLKTYLAGEGLNLTNWTLNECRGISANGRVFVGTGIDPSGNFESWRADLGPLPPPLGDMNCDGVVNTIDIDAFVLALLDAAAYGATYPSCSIFNGDFNSDLAVNGLDCPGFVQAVVGS